MMKTQCLLTLIRGSGCGTVASGVEPLRPPFPQLCHRRGHVPAASGNHPGDHDRVTGAERLHDHLDDGQWVAVAIRQRGSLEIHFFPSSSTFFPLFSSTVYAKTPTRRLVATKGNDRRRINRG